MHDTFRLEYAENTGAAMSMGDKLPGGVSLWLLGILPLAALCMLFIFMVKTKMRQNTLSFVKVILILAGGVGNISDRLLYKRHVTDFMNIGIDGVRSGIFNFADVYITIGVALFLFAALTDKGFTYKQSR